MVRPCKIFSKFIKFEKCPEFNLISQNLKFRAISKIKKIFPHFPNLQFQQISRQGTPVEVPSNRISSFTHVRLRELRPQILTRNVKKMAKIEMFPRV